MSEQYCIQVWDVWESDRKLIYSYWGLMVFDTEREAWKWADSHLSGDRYPRNQREVYPASRFIVKRPTSM